jgi:phage tail P2-like protein
MEGLKMISLYDSEISNILPININSSPDVQALSYAIKIQMQKLQDFAKQGRSYAAIHELQHNILDELAIELRAHYYDEALPIETKRNIIQNTLMWYRYAGTPLAVEELVSTLLGSGKIIEWFNFEGGAGTPGTFEIETKAQLTLDTVNKFTSMIQKVKNIRSHLTKIYFIDDSYESNFNASGIVYIPKITVKDSGL